ncbi:MAG: response regulator transcription factor [Myxococcota bacterium]
MLILVVEDEASVSQFLTRGLREEGHTVDLAETGEDAIRQGVAQPYDVVLLDWMLPDLDGLTVLRRWRDRGMDSPVIMLTARTGVEATVLALDEGADDYIEKPFSFEELLARVRAHARRAESSGSGSRLAQIGTASVDLREREVRRGEQAYELTNREFRLLDFFLKHRGEVLSRSRILDRVWDAAHDPMTNVVDVYVRYLRDKLDPSDTGPADSVIETVRGAGYRLREGPEEQDA